MRLIFSHDRNGDPVNYRGRAALKKAEPKYWLNGSCKRCRHRWKRREQTCFLVSLRPKYSHFSVG